jgi:hypothetical protein
VTAERDELRGGRRAARRHDQPPARQRWIELRIPGADTGVTLFTPPGHEDRIGTFQSLSFWADDVEQTYAALRERGVEFLAPAKKEPWGTSVVLKDSEGNQLHPGSR